MCAPKSAGFLYARPERQALLHPLVVSWGWESLSPGVSPFIDFFEWRGTHDPAAYLMVKMLVSIGVGAVECWNIQTGSISQWWGVDLPSVNNVEIAAAGGVLARHTDTVNAFAPSGHLVASGSSDGTVRLWRF